ncbi:hypothetical protein HEP87_22825 [Streptomyces sp. S1D4-11]|nr:hypothetical protein [Streptomyces sp. S1D4-11]QIY96333.1 hypothetical protein HEP87_22825 [Streptomyces sp. S1D4-11]
MTGPTYDMSRSPVPVDGCEACRELAARRHGARAVFDHSAVSDANVRMRAHLRQEHGG